MLSKTYICLLWGGYLLVFPFSTVQSLTLTIGTLSYNPPYETQLNKAPKNEFYGFEIYIMDEICKRIDASCLYKAMSFPEILKEINANNIDLGMATIAITPQRRQSFLFSIPYKISSNKFIVLNSASFKSIEQLKGKRIGIYSGSPSAAFVKRLFKNNIKIKYYTIAENMFDALDNHEISAAITSSEQADFWCDNMYRYKILGEKLPNIAAYAILAKLGNQELIEKINNALIDMEMDGTYIKLYNLSF